MRSQAHQRGRPRQAVISGNHLEGEAAISEPVKEVRVEPAERPDIDELIQALRDVIEDDEDIDGGPGASDLSLSRSLSFVSMSSSLSLSPLTFLFPLPFPYMYSTTIP
jgi:hypothetical protein